MTADAAAPPGCPQPDCTGAPVDGYCDLCGSPEVLPAPPIPPSAAPDGRGGGTGTGQAGTRRTTSSAGLAASAVGSARAAAGPGHPAGPGPAAGARAGSSGRTRTGRLGAGLTTVPTLPVIDATAAVMARPEVPEERRTCPTCGHPVGRSRSGAPGRTEGFCPRDGTAYSFSPKLRAGDLVAGQYEVAGCLAFGGLGWVYLARDRNVSDRWVVLKGLLNSADPDAAAAAIAEREFLAAVAHPLIVKIYNFVTHDDGGYIVMEYVGGTSLKQVLKDRRQASGGTPDPIPADHAIAYVLEVLPALGYLHDQGLLYCDLKPDNVIQVGDGVKLIDLGGVRRASDLDSPIYGTVGYQAREVPDVGPSVASDVHTAGRTLLSLAVDVRGNTSTYATSLPPVDQVPLFGRHDSLHRWLLKACADDPADRFVDCEEARTQLIGVLREVVARDRPGLRAADHSAPSTLFRPPLVAGATLAWRDLPALRVDEEHPQLLDVLQRVRPGDGDQAMIEELLAVADPAVEVLLVLARTCLDGGRPADAVEACERVVAADPWQWRADWYLGVAALQQDDDQGAQAAFNAVYGQVPGELAPKLALALACERGTDLAVAEQLYLTCLRTDATYVAAAAFGLSRVHERLHAAGEGDLDDAIRALDHVSATSRAFVPARRRQVELLVDHADGLPRLVTALDGVARLPLDPREALGLRARVLAAALDRVLDHGARPDLLVGDVPAEEAPLRRALEAAYRQLVPLADVAERVRLVDAARAVRPWSWT